MTPEPSKLIELLRDAPEHNYLEESLNMLIRCIQSETAEECAGIVDSYCEAGAEAIRKRFKLKIANEGN